MKIAEEEQDFMDKTTSKARDVREKIDKDVRHKKVAMQSVTFKKDEKEKHFNVEVKGDRLEVSTKVAEESSLGKFPRNIPRN